MRQLYLTVLNYNQNWEFLEEYSYRLVFQDEVYFAVVVHIGDKYCLKGLSFSGRN